MKIKLFVLFILLVSNFGFVFCDEQADAIAELRRASPWIPADSKIMKNSDGSWKILDNVKLPFVDDSTVLGVWKAFDYVQDPEMINPNEKSFTRELFWKSIEFQKGGYQVSYFGTFKNTSNKWTKGLYLDVNPNEATSSKYEIRKIMDKDFLIVEWKSGDYSRRGAKPQYYVFVR